VSKTKEESASLAENLKFIIFIEVDDEGVELTISTFNDTEDYYLTVARRYDRELS
jgi:hypothetical protein